MGEVLLFLIPEQNEQEREQRAYRQLPQADSGRFPPHRRFEGTPNGLSPLQGEGDPDPLRECAAQGQE